MSDDHLISALKALCLRFATSPLDGRHEVARRTGLSEQYLYQILSGKPMANGNSRSIGKAARTKISAAFPDWLDQGLPITLPPAQNLEAQAQRHSRRLLQRLCDVADTINDLGLMYLIGKAEEVAKTNPQPKTDTEKPEKVA